MKLTSMKWKAILFGILIGAQCPAFAYKVYGGIGEKWRALGAENGVLGAPTSDETDLPKGGRFQSFQKGHVVWRPSTGAHTMFGLIYEKWKSMGGVDYGFPIIDESPAARGGRYQDFNIDKSIYWSTPTGAHAVYGHIRNKWRELGGDNSPLKYPTTDELPAAKGGRMSAFEGGDIYWHLSTGAHVVYGLIREEWKRGGAEAGECGYPTKDEFKFNESQTTGHQGYRSEFQNGSISWSTTKKISMVSCGAQVPKQPTLPPREACLISVTIKNQSCLNVDGTPSTILEPGKISAAGCGDKLENARIRAKQNFQQFSCIADQPSPGCCTYSEETVQGCLCN